LSESLSDKGYWKVFLFAAMRLDKTKDMKNVFFMRFLDLKKARMKNIISKHRRDWDLLGDLIKSKESS